MTRIIILGATGSLGKHVAEQAVAATHEVSVLVRTPAKLPADLRDRVTVHQADITTLPASQLAALARNQDALIHAAGHVSEGHRFVALIDHVVTSVETLPASERPVCWFLAGAALLDIDDTGRRGVDFPPIAEDLLAARGQLRAPPIVVVGLAAALSRSDGRGPASRPPSAAACRETGCRSRSRVQPGRRRTSSSSRSSCGSCRR